MKNNIDSMESVCYYSVCELSHAVVAQSVVRRIGSAEVTGSIPVSSLKKPLFMQGLLFFWDREYLRAVDDSTALLGF